MPSPFSVESMSQRAALPRPSRAFLRREIQLFLRRLVTLTAAISVLIFAGAASFAAFESISYWEGLMESVDVVATVGAIEHPSTLGGEITKVVLITFGLGTMFYLLVTLTELFVAGHLAGLMETRRMHKKISELRDHYLICGFGRVGQQVARDLLEAGVDFVVIDPNPDVRDAMEEMEVLHVDGPASDDEVLVEAGIREARGVLACIDSDAENIFVALTARELQPDIEIVARASQEASERKLLRAGANDVVSPYKASGDTMARLALGAQRSGQVADRAPSRSEAEREPA